MGIAFSCCKSQSEILDKPKNQKEQYIEDNKHSVPFSSSQQAFLNQKLIDQEQTIDTSTIPLKASELIIEPVDDNPFFGIEKASLIGKSTANPKERYEFIKKIGQGSYGEVFQVRNLETNAVCAMKIIKKKKEGLNLSINKINSNEINLLMSLDHPNIIKIFEFYESPSKFYIVTEYCQGGELFDKLKSDGIQGEFPSAIIMFQLFSAISYCHQRKVMHRDLKPENIMLENNKKNGNLYIRLIDFGTAKLCQEVFESQVIGTCYYLAPEVLNKKYNEKCDLWSCGVILYVLMKGKVPFGGKTETQIFENIKKGEYKILDSDVMSDEVKDLIGKLLEKDVNKRISALEALEHPWFKKLRIKEKLCDLPSTKIRELLQNIYGYFPGKILQQAAIAYLIHNVLLDSPEVYDARCLFYRVDKNNDGSITKKEFTNSLLDLFIEQKQTVNIDYLENSFVRIDADNSGEIDYEEFLRAAVNKTLFMQEKYLRTAFSFFSSGDNNQYITLDNIKKVFKQKKDFPDEEFQKVIAEVDKNDDGVIDYNEFEEMMKRILGLMD